MLVSDWSEMRHVILRWISDDNLFLQLLIIFFYNFTKLLGQNKNHTLFLFHNFCLAVAFTCLISSYPVLVNCDKFEKETWEILPSCQWKSTLYTILETLHRCICIYIYFLQWAFRSMCNLSIIDDILEFSNFVN